MIERLNTVATVGHRYRLVNVLGAGGIGIVYRALDRLTGQIVALKQISFRRNKYVSDLQAALAEEFRALATMHHPHIIRVLDYSLDNHSQPFFTMELLENALTIREAGRGQPFSVKISLLLQLLQALAYLHRRGIVHRDLKPGNVLVVGNQVKLLDFGFSMVDKLSGRIVGTPYYIAPEILAGRPGNARGDLYAVGAMGYELFFERNLFDDPSTETLSDIILGDMSAIESAVLDKPLRHFLGRLCASKPEDRYADADEAIQALTDATQQPLSSESVAIRESFLQAARFVGRGAELSYLSGLLLSAAARHGSYWLIGGESGVGKSRLLDEFRTLALIRDSLVLRGQVNNYRKAPYQLWREPVRHLLVSTEITDQEASVLKGVVRDLETILERPVPETTALDRSAGQIQLADTISGIIDRLQKPTILILEDVHNASNEDLALLNEISTHVQDMPVLILASYRNDDYPNFPSRQAHAQVLQLNRLKIQDIADLSLLLLGPEGKHPELIEMLQRESEGNVYFLIEIVRSLKETAGPRWASGTFPISSELYTGGVRQIIERRLNRIPTQARPLLYIAALGENQIDPTVLRSIAHTIDFDEWAALCAEAAVLTFLDDSWRFSHGQFKQALLKELTPKQQRTLHEEIAVAIEAVYPDLSAYEVELAYHWGNAGNAAKELRYAMLAGEHALNRGDIDAALAYLTRALELEAASGLQGSRVKQAALTRLIANAYFVSGDLERGRGLLEQALTLLHFEIPKTQAGLFFGLLLEGFTQILHRIIPPPFRQPSEASWQASRAYDRLGQLSNLNDGGAVQLYIPLRQANLAEIDGAPDLRARAYASLSVALSSTPFARFTEDYSRQAKALARETGDLGVLSWVLQLAGLREASLGRWREAEGDLSQAKAITLKIGDIVRAQECAIVLAVAMVFEGRLSEATRLGTTTSNLIYPGTNSANWIWLILIQAEIALMRGGVDEALTLLVRASPHIADSTLPHQKLWLYALRALSYVYLGVYDLARQQADNALVMVRKMRLAPAIFALPAVTLLAEVYLTLTELQKDRDTKDAVQLVQAARESCANLRAISQSCPVGQPAYWLSRGWFEWLAGNRRQADYAWHKSLALAERFGMPYLQALAHFRLGKYLHEHSVWHLEQAIAIFTRFESLYNLAQATITLRERQKNPNPAR